MGDGGHDSRTLSAGCNIWRCGYDSATGIGTYAVRMLTKSSAQPAAQVLHTRSLSLILDLLHVERIIWQDQPHTQPPRHEKWHDAILGAIGQHVQVVVHGLDSSRDDTLRAPEALRQWLSLFLIHLSPSHPWLQASVRACPATYDRPLSASSVSGELSVGCTLKRYSRTIDK